MKKHLAELQLWKEWRLFHRHNKLLWRRIKLKCQMTRYHTYLYRSSEPKASTVHINGNIRIKVDFLYGFYKSIGLQDGLAFALLDISYNWRRKHRLAVHKDDWEVLPNYLRVEILPGLNKTEELMGSVPIPRRLEWMRGKLVLGQEIE
jgi:hypothetical protein